ncbi:MAG: hypothetical protein AAF802_19085, partial [Planctomycetota bacterium]
VSAIGFTPDVFLGPAMGWLLDRSPGETGHQHLFAMLSLFALVGCVAAYAYPSTGKSSSTDEFQT